MKLKLVIFVALAMFFTACGDSAGDTQKETTKEIKVETSDEKVKVDKDNVEVTGNDGEKVEIKDDGLKVKDGNKEISITKDGISIKENEDDGKNPKDGDKADSEKADNDDNKLAEKLTLKGVNEKKTVECKGRRAQINGTGNTYTLTGECAAVLINGTGQKINVEKVGRINVNGMGNKVVYKEGLDGNDPKISDAGTGNSVSKQ